MDSSSATASLPELLVGNYDGFGDVIVDPLSLPADPPSFLRALQNSLAHWKSQGKKGILLKLLLKNAHLVPVAIEEGFCYHHAEKDYLMLTYWIPESSSTLPANASVKLNEYRFQPFKSARIAAMLGEHEMSTRAYHRLLSMVQGDEPNYTARIRAHRSVWANPFGLQWKDINKLVDKDMIKSIWRGVSNDNISKGRLKLSQCSNNDIKEHGERIFLDVMGQPMHHEECSLLFAKMLYCNFVLQRPVDFSSKTPTLLAEDIKSSTITVTREELSLALQGAACEVHDAKEGLQTQLHASQENPEEASSSSRDMARELKIVQRQLQKMEEQCAYKFIQCIEHPNTILPPPLLVVLLVDHVLFAMLSFMSGAAIMRFLVGTYITSHA